MKEKNTLLIVDDYEFNRYMLCNAFSDRNIIEAENVFRAIEEYERHKDEICAVLTDLMMPVLDGFGLLEYFQKNKYTEEIPVFVITADNSAKSLTKAHDMGAQDYISKPFNIQFIRRRVNNIIELFELRKKLDAHKDKDEYSDMV